MSSDTVKEALCEYKTNRIMQGKTNWNFPNPEIDTIHEKLCNVIITEMEKVIPFFMKPIILKNLLNTQNPTEIKNYQTYGRSCTKPKKKTFP